MAIRHTLPHKLFKKQVDFIQSKARYTLYSGAFRGGKTLALSYAAIIKSMGADRILICCHTYKMLSRVILPTFREILKSIPSMFWTYNKSEQYFTIDWGNNECEIILSHLQDPTAIQGMTLDHYFLDEATAGVTNEAFEMLNSRLSKTGATANIATNPGPISHWCYEFFFNNPSKDKNIIYAKTKDNPHLPEDYLKDLEHRPKEWRDRYLEGEWGILEGLIYQEFSREKHIQDIELQQPEYYLSMDWGYDHPFACLLIAIDNDGNLHVADELYRTKATIDVLIELIRNKFTTKYNIESFVCDISRPDNRDMVQAELDLGNLPGNNKTKYVQAGIELIQLLLYRNKLTISPKCINLIKEFESYMHKPDLSTGGFRDEPVKLNDDGLDALRYFAMTMKNAGYLGIIQ